MLEKIFIGEPLRLFLDGKQKRIYSTSYFQKKPRPNDKHEQDSEAPKKTQTPGVEQTILKAVADIPLLVRPYPEVSTFVPSAHMMYYVLHVMDTSLISIKHWSSQLPRWNPLPSRAYYGILFYIQTLRCMKAAGILPGDLMRFLNTFEESFPFESLIIAGPLTPFFKALSVCSPPYLEYGYVTPALPALPGATIASHLALDLRVRTLLPNLIGLYRGIHTSKITIGNNDT
jgi:hypothetical protein